MQRSRIVGTGTYLPERVVTNDDLSQKMGIDTTDSWIRERTGIGARRIAAPNEATSDMATAASKRALDMAGVRPEELDLIICGTVTADMPFPAAACFVQSKIGATKAAAFDVSAACAGSLFALSIADQYIRGGMARMVLVPETRTDRGLLSTHLHTDGTQTSILNIPGGGSLKPMNQDVLDRRDQFIKMNGREVYKTAVRALEACSREALERNGYRPQDVDRVIAHQANLRILEHVMKRLEIPLEKCEQNIEQVGNTSSASVPLTLDQANRGGRLKDGDLVLMMAIGGGMAWGSALVKW